MVASLVIVIFVGGTDVLKVVKLLGGMVALILQSSALVTTSAEGIDEDFVFVFVSVSVSISVSDPEVSFTVSIISLVEVVVVVILELEVTEGGLSQVRISLSLPWLTIPTP